MARAGTPELPEWPDTIGYLAAALVVATFYMRSMIALRAFGILGNIAFIVYGAQAGLPPVLLLHLVLLPLNLVRLAEAAPRRRAGRRLQTMPRGRRGRAAEIGTLSSKALRSE